jgi:RNA polymerase sigma-70 factor (ECF subfamily)
VKRQIFPTTRGSVVAALASDEPAERTRAFETLVNIYWTPLGRYAQIAHRRDDADDLTQAFLAIAFERESLSAYDVQKGRFRTFLRTLFDRFIANHIRDAARLKRGGDLKRVELTEHAGTETPEVIFEREWARSVFTVALERLRRSIDEAAFGIFEQYDLHGGTTYADLATRFALPETTVTNRLSAARRSFRKIVLDLLREITVSETEFRAEARALLGTDA